MSAPTVEPQSGADLLARIRPTRREETVGLCLRPDLLEAWEKANEALTHRQMEDASAGRLASGISQATRKLAAEVKKIEDEIEATEATFRLRALTKDQWRSLCDQHPPRRDNEIDLYSGYNRDAVVDAAVRECLVDPVFDDASWAAFLDVCNPSEWAELRNVVTSVNRSVTSAPKSVLASQILTKRARNSRSPEHGE